MEQIKNPEAKMPGLEMTAEQRAIIQSTGNIKINAVAGSGKTTTIIHYAASRPAGSRILYLAYNKSVKLEAQKKFDEQGLHNVRVETAHSLAYRPIVVQKNYTVRQQEYKIHEIAELLGLTGNGEKHGEYILANHIHKFINYFCNSDKLKVQDLNYLDIVNDGKAKAFVMSFYQAIENGARILLSKMHKGEIEIMHDFYLKLFQLSMPQLPYDYILFDEGQDASPAMLDIFLQQAATKVIVGDAHQQIYAWRHAVNSLEKADFTTYHLSTSFRFNQSIANLATNILAWKNHLRDTPPVAITGKSSGAVGKVKATLARSNLGLLLRAISFITEHKEVKHLYFEGNINSYTYADDGASLYDVLSLHNNNHDRIKDKLIRSMKDFGELEEYVEKTEDVQLGMMMEIVNEYGNEIPGLIKSLKEKHVGDKEKDKAEMIFSTVHRAKGMEYDAVQLVADFITEAKLERLKAEKKEDEALPVAKLNEEINLLYVAVTRTKNLLRIPETLLPKDFPASPTIHVIKLKGEENKNAGTPITGVTGNNKNENQKAVSFAEIRLAHKNAYMPWNEELDAELRAMYYKGVRLKEIARHFNRKDGAIASRLKKIGCLDF